MDIYSQQLLKSISPQAIKSIFVELHKTMHFNNVVDIT